MRAEATLKGITVQVIVERPACPILPLRGPPLDRLPRAMLDKQLMRFKIEGGETTGGAVGDHNCSSPGGVQFNRHFGGPRIRPKSFLEF